jgi:CubicO group peptidase (beta-lactamase class C family)
MASHLWTKSFVALCLAVLLAACAPSSPAPMALPTPPAMAAPRPTTAPADWPTSSPEAQGMDSTALLAALDAAREQKLAMDGLLVARNGTIVMEAYFGPYGPDTLHDLYSCTKSFVSTLVGIAIDQGKLAGVHEPVLSFFPGRTFPNTDSRKQALTLEHLLTMTSGLQWTEADAEYVALYRSGNWVGNLLGRPMVDDPGARFNYSSGASHIISAILQQATGTTTLALARDSLLGPLGIRNYTWEADAQGIAIGGWGLRLSPRDMARLGQLYLDGGVWQGQRIVSADWVRQATATHVDGPDNLGYGYQWWVHPALHGYMARGRGGQLIFVAPEPRLVIVFTATDQNDGAFFKLIEEHILPAARSASPLPENPEALAALRTACGAVAH